MQGKVLKSTGSWYKVEDESNQIIDCRIKGKIRLDELKSTNPIAVGDNVLFEIETNTKQGVITEILERKNYIIRKASNLSKQSHIIASNVDRAYIIVTLHSPNTLMSFVDRLLASAEAYEIPCTIVFNKIDLYESNEDIENLHFWKETYTKAGYEFIEISTKTGFQIDILKEQLYKQVSVLAGNSGVGKTSIMQCICPELELKTMEVSKSHNKGQHTTTFAEMYKISETGYVIDTPGIKAFGLINMDKDEISHYFPEILRYSENCQYNNCSHIHEPNCSVIEAVEKGNIAISRYENYVSLLDDDNDKHRK